MCSARIGMEETESKAEHQHSKAEHESSSTQRLKTCDGSTADIPINLKEMSSALKREASSTLSNPYKKRRIDIQQEGYEGEMEPQDDKRRLACPFFKRKPTRARPSCVYPGFSSIARLKEHLYRQHMLPPHLCPRCLKTFKSEADLREHSRAPVPCQVNTDKQVEGITLEQEKALKSKKRTSKSGINNDEEKWKDIYTILFPDEKPPTAFCDTVSDTPRYEEILRQELPALVKAEIERNESLSDHSDEILDIVWNCLEKTFAKWHRSTNELHAGVTPTTTEMPPPGREPSAGDAPEPPKGTDVSTPDPASPPPLVGVVKGTRNDLVSGDSAQPETQPAEDFKQESTGV